VPAIRVERPIVRSFSKAHEREAARHVRAGGHAIVWAGPKTAQLVFRVPKEPATDLGLWSLLDLDRWRWRKIDKGPMLGLATARVPVDCLFIVKERIDRDSVFPGTTKPEKFDCLKCGACCKSNEVVLNRSDVARIRRRRPEFIAKPYVRRRRDGKLMLTLLKNGKCRHLGGDLKCGIYEFRPDPCSSFVVGSECCMSAREEEGVTPAPTRAARRR
jgi:hypothetical protein